MADALLAGRRSATVCWVAWCLVITTAGLARPCVPVALGQLQMDDPFGADQSATDPDALPGFGVPIDQKLKLALDDFHRYLEKKAWGRAFRAVTEVAEKDEPGMLPAEHGFILPARERIWQLLAGLPPEARDAYRVFYDAKAEQLLKAAGSEGGARSEAELEAARQVFDRYFLTSAGDEAGNLLGDARFEEGRFLEADRAWKAVLDYHPDSGLDEGKLWLKRGIALWRAGRQEEVAEIAGVVRNRFAGTTVVLAGREVDPAAFLDKLIASGEAVTPAGAAVEPDPIQTGPGAPPEGAEPLWQHQFLSPHARQQVVQAMQNGWVAFNGVGNFVPRHDTDGRRIYCNWFGVCFALDVNTGKLLWWTDRYTKLDDRFNNFSHNSDVQRYDLTVSGDLVLAVNMNLDRLNHHQEPYRLVALEAETGKERWGTEDGSSGETKRSFMGRPAVWEGQVLALAHEPGKNQCNLIALGLADGSVRWQLSLGTFQAANNPWSGQQMIPAPALLVLDHTLYALTDNGAVVAVDLAAQRVLWVYKYPPPLDAVQPRNPWGSDGRNHLNLHARPTMIYRDGVLYFKETDSPALYALDVTKRELLWKRPVPEEAVLAGFDEECFYLMAQELEAIDRRTRGLRWSVSLPVAAGGLGVVIGDDRLATFTSRGIFELSKQNGDVVRIFRGADMTSLGGASFVLDGKYVTISNQAITAYPLEN